MRKRALLALLGLSLVTFAGVGHAEANSIGPDCLTCQGSHLLIPHDTLLTIASIKTRYVDASGLKVGDLLSENIKISVIFKVPDGDAGTFELLGFALMGIGAALLLERFFKGARPSFR